MASAATCIREVTPQPQLLGLPPGFPEAFAELDALAAFEGSKLSAAQRSADALLAGLPDPLFAAACEARWQPPAAASGDVDIAESIVHRVEAPRDLSHPYSFDRIETPLDADYLDKPRRLTIRLPLRQQQQQQQQQQAAAAAPGKKAHSELGVGELDEAARDSLDREIVATIAPVEKQQPQQREIRAPRPDGEEGASGGLVILKHLTSTARVPNLTLRPDPELPARSDDRSLESLESLRTAEADRAKRPEAYVGAYSREARKARVAIFLKKRAKRVWTKKVKYDVRKNFADSRMRVKGRFVKKEDEDLLRDLVSVV